MIKTYLTCERYLENYNKGEKTVVGRLDTPKHVCVTETDMSQEAIFYNSLGMKIPRHVDHYLVGPIAETLHAYEELGYTPEELKKIIEEHKKIKERSLFITTHYGVWNSPFSEKFKKIREDFELERALYGKFDAEYAIESLYPRVMPTKTAYDIIKELVEKFENKPSLKSLEIDEWARAQITPAKTKPKHPIVERAIFNDPATIVFWKDGTKTVVKAQKGEKYDPEKGLAMAFSKKMFGNEGNYYDQFTKLLPKKNAKK